MPSIPAPLACLVLNYRGSRVLSCPSSTTSHMFSLLRQSLVVLLPLSLLSTTYLYTYPYLLRCAFPPQIFPDDTSIWHALKHFAEPSTAYGGTQAPFRLLALGDPQLEGSSSHLNPEHGWLPSLNTLQSDVLEAATTRDKLDALGKHILDLTIVDIPRFLDYFRKRLDLVGNDYYLANIYRTLHRALKPTHVTVLGDLLGSQWVSDEEFGKRASRFWNRVFKHGQRVDDEITRGISFGLLGEDRAGSEGSSMLQVIMTLDMLGTLHRRGWRDLRGLLAGLIGRRDFHWIDGIAALPLTNIPSNIRSCESSSSTT